MKTARRTPASETRRIWAGVRGRSCNAHLPALSPGSLRWLEPGACVVRRPHPERLRESEPAAQAAGALATGTEPVGRESPGAGARRRAPNTGAGPLVPALLPARFAAPAAAQRLQRPRGRHLDPSARAAKAPRVRPGLARAERAGPGSPSPSAHPLRRRAPSTPDASPAGPRPPGRAWMPPPGRRDGALLGEQG